MTNKNNLEIIFHPDSAESLTHPFYKKQIVFTGALSTMTRSEAAKQVKACGGSLQELLHSKRISSFLEINVVASVANSIRLNS